MEDEMKRKISLGVVVVGALFLYGLSLVAQNPASPGVVAPPAGSEPVNFNAVALLRWYQANQVPTTFALPGNGHSGVVFDGEHIWVTTANSGNVTELQASTGATVGTFSTGSSATGSVAFDGANI